MKYIKIMTRKRVRVCLNRFEPVGTCLNRAVCSNSVGTLVLRKIGERSEFGGIMGFVGTV